MPLAMEVGRGAGDFVFDGDPATPENRALPSHLIFGPCLLWPNGWMDEDATWYTSRPRPMPHIILDGVAALREGGTAAPLFPAMSIVATVTHVSYC